MNFNVFGNKTFEMKSCRIEVCSRSEDWHLIETKDAQIRADSCVMKEAVVGVKQLEAKEHPGCLEPPEARRECGTDSP